MTKLKEPILILLKELERKVTIQDLIQRESEVKQSKAEMRIYD